jgi:cyclophilin family peptidyl-prolyl cis-trans isomerase
VRILWLSWGISTEKEVEVKITVGIVLALILSLALSIPLFGQDTAETEVKAEVKTEKKEVENPMVMIETNHGNIMLELFQKEAPISVDNFLSYVEDGFYDGTIFHRVVSGFVLQAGGMNDELKQKQQKAPIKNEATNGLKNLRGTLSMARTSDINSGTSHFFINLKDNSFLDHTGMNPQQYGYAVFGKVADEASMKVVDKIAEVPVTDKGQFKNVPAKPVVIEKAVVVGGEKEAEAKEMKEAAPEKVDTEAEALKQEQKKLEEQGE